MFDLSETPLIGIPPLQVIRPRVAGGVGGTRRQRPIGESVWVMDSASGGGAADPSGGEGPSAGGGGGAAEGSSPAPPSRYESQKRRDWNTFLQYLKNHKPPLTLARCSGAHVIEFLNLDALIGRLRAAYEENGGRPESNPFGARAVRIYLREVREGQAKARGIPYEKKKRKRPTVTATAVVVVVMELVAVAVLILAVLLLLLLLRLLLPYSLTNFLPFSPLNSCFNL
ncbi:unnamed protein product, partial [Vitis vinifera]